VTTSPDRAREFFQLVNKRAIVKSIDVGHAMAWGEVLGIFTTKIPESQNFSLVRNCPTYIQEEIIKKNELRITIIGKKIFAVAMDTQKYRGTKIDWRKAQEYIASVPHHVVTIPLSLEKRLRKLIDHYSLQFGAIDMAITPEGEYVFFELNPAGQFLWLEDVTGLPLAQEMAKFLLGKQKV